MDDALIDGLEQNQDFFSLLLSNDEIKREVLGIFTEEIYKSLREADSVGVVYNTYPDGQLPMVAEDMVYGNKDEG